MLKLGSNRLASAARYLFAAALALCAWAHARADVTLPDVLSNSMVLQSGVRVPVWGRAAPGESVTVRFGGQTRTAAAGADGRWSVRLNPLKASPTRCASTASRPPSTTA